MIQQSSGPLHVHNSGNLVGATMTATIRLRNSQSFSPVHARTHHAGTAKSKAPPAVRAACALHLKHAAPARKGWRTRWTQARVSEWEPPPALNRRKNHRERRQAMRPRQEMGPRMGRLVPPRLRPRLRRRLPFPRYQQSELPRCLAGSSGGSRTGGRAARGPALPARCPPLPRS